MDPSPGGGAGSPAVLRHQHPLLLLLLFLLPPQPPGDGALHPGKVFGDRTPFFLAPPDPSSLLGLRCPTEFANELIINDLDESDGPAPAGVSRVSSPPPPPPSSQSQRTSRGGEDLISILINYHDYSLIIGITFHGVELRGGTGRGKISTVSGARPKFSRFYERSGRRPGALTRL